MDRLTQMDIENAADAHKAWLEEKDNGLKANFRGKDLSGLDLSCKNFINADFTGANLRNTNLEKAKLTGAKLVDADLAFSSLKNANLEYSDLTGASFRGVDARGVNFTSSKVSNMDLRDCKGIRVSCIIARYKTTTFEITYWANRNLWTIEDYQGTYDELIMYTRKLYKSSPEKLAVIGDVIDYIKKTMQI